MLPTLPRWPLRHNVVLRVALPLARVTQRQLHPSQQHMLLLQFIL